MRQIENVQIILRNTGKIDDVLEEFKKYLKLVASSTNVKVKKKILHEKVEVAIINLDKMIKPITLMKIIDYIETKGYNIYFITYKSIKENKYEIKIEMEAM